MDPGWPRIRARFIRMNPRCVRCGELANVVDHKIPRRQFRKSERHLYNHWSNLQSMCTRCHNRKTGSGQ